jgi:hypothetical protein
MTGRRSRGQDKPAQKGHSDTDDDDNDDEDNDREKQTERKKAHNEIALPTIDKPAPPSTIDKRKAEDEESDESDSEDQAQPLKNDRKAVVSPLPTLNLRP